MHKEASTFDDFRIMFSTIFSNAEVGILYLTQDGSILEVNDSAAKIFGGTKEELVGKHFIDTGTLDSKDIPVVLKSFKEIVNGTGCSLDLYITNKAGKRLFVESCALVIKMHQQIDGVMVMVRDATERMIHAEQLQNQENYLHDLLNGVATGIVVIDAVSHEIVDMNREAERMIGGKRKDILGKVCHQYICPAEMGKCPISDLGQDIDHSERKLLTIQGSVVPILKTVVYATLRNRKYLLETFIDITDTKKAELALIKERDFAKSVLETAHVIVLVLDEDGTILSMNPYMEQISGYQENELIGKNLFTTFFVESEQERIRAHIKSVLQENSSCSILTTFRDRDGNIHEIQWYDTTLKDESRTSPAILCIGHDVTEQRRIEEQLRQAEKMHAIGQLAGGIAHDFNNQLTCIMGYTEMLRDRITDNPVSSRFTNNILASVKRAAKLTSQLLAFARKGKYFSVNVDIHRMLQEIVALLEHSFNKKIVIKQQFHAKPSITVGDPTQLQNVFLNLSLNARDAMPQGGVLKLETDIVYLDEYYCIHSSYEITPGKYLQISVSDTGIGMDKQTLHHIFEPFFTTKEEGKGVGMGLAAVYGTIKSHNGAIEVESKVNKGSVFRIFLPLLKKEHLDPVDNINPVKESCIEGNAHILLVDDEKMLCEMVKEMLESIGYKVSIAYGGKEAIQFYKHNWNVIDIVILDMIMPYMDGYQTFVELQKINGAVKVLLSSGYSLNEEAQKILNAGVLDFIQKPYKKAHLSHIIAKTLSLNS